MIYRKKVNVITFNLIKTVLGFLLFVFFFYYFVFLDRHEAFSFFYWVYNPPSNRRSMNHSGEKSHFKFTKPIKEEKNCSTFPSSQSIVHIVLYYHMQANCRYF